MAVEREKASGQAVDDRFAQLAAVATLVQCTPFPLPPPPPCTAAPLLLTLSLSLSPALSFHPFWRTEAWAVDNVIYTGRVINVLGDRRFKKTIGNRRQRRATVVRPPVSWPPLR